MDGSGAARAENTNSKGQQQAEGSVKFEYVSQLAAVPLWGVATHAFVLGAATASASTDRSRRRPAGSLARYATS
jgi:hypothetical protein